MIHELPRRGAPFLAAFVFLATFSVCASAGTQDNVVFALHASPYVQKGDPCELIEQYYLQGDDCVDFSTTCEMNRSYSVYIALGGGDPDFGIALASFGLSYNNGSTGGSTLSDQSGVDVYEWTPCHSGTEVSYPPAPSPDAFPASGSGLRITWDAESDCRTEVPGRTGVEIVLGSLYVFAYSPDVLTVTPNEHGPDGSEYIVDDCDGVRSWLRYGLNYTAFLRFSTSGTEPGYSPCWLVPVRGTSWSRLKTTYTESETRP